MYLKRLKKKQIIVAGCETDVCVLQSCLGLLDLGFDVFAVEELLFSSTSRTEAAVERLKSAGVIFVSYKTLYFELVEAVADGPHEAKMIARLGAFPDDSRRTPSTNDTIPGYVIRLIARTSLPAALMRAMASRVSSITVAM